MAKRIYVVATVQHDALHSWPEAKNYLQYPHRHIFHVRIKLEVTHGNREIEFIGLKEELAQYCRKRWPQDICTPDSCEMRAADIGDHFRQLYAFAVKEVSVFEDGENGAVVTWD